VLSQTLSLYRKHFGALVLTCAVALLPANLLAAGALVFGLASLGSGGLAEARTHTQQVNEKQQALREKPPATPEAREVRTRELGREALEGGSTVDLRSLLGRVIPVAYATVIIAAVLLGGLFLAHAAAAPLVLDLMQGSRCGPARAWAVAGSRIRALLATGLPGALLVALGALFFVIPGLVLAAGFSFAAPVAVLEDTSGRAALERSWRLLAGHWRPVLLMWALIVLFSVLASMAAALVPPGPGRPIVTALVRIVLYPLPLTGLVLAYRDATQYMRRISAPG
jgi:hypothetical protein